MGILQWSFRDLEVFNVEHNKAIIPWFLVCEVIVLNMVGSEAPEFHILNFSESSDWEVCLFILLPEINFRSGSILPISTWHEFFDGWGHIIVDKGFSSCIVAKR